MKGELHVHQPEPLVVPTSSTPLNPHTNLEYISLMEEDMSFDVIYYADPFHLSA